MRLKSIHLSAVGAAVAGLLVLSGACGDDNKTPTQPTTPTAPTIAAPALKAPVGGNEVSDAQPILEVTNSTVTGNAGTLTYTFQVSEDGGFPNDSRTVTSDKVPQGSGTTTWQVSQKLVPGSTYYWRAQATNGTVTSDWAKMDTFKTKLVGYVNGHTIFDPLTNGISVGNVGGGHFVPGRGWQADYASDFINYDIATMTAGSLEFDITGVQSDEPGCPSNCNYDKGLKFYAMGDGSQWDFNGFRNQPFKASLDKKTGKIYGGESGVVEHIFRVNGDDNRTKTGQNVFHDAQVYHVKLVWGRGHVRSTIDDMVIADEGYGGEYAPANHRIALGCSARTETLTGAIWSNVRIGPQ